MENTRRSLPVVLILAMVAIVMATFVWQSSTSNTRAAAPSCGFVGRGTNDDCVRHEHKGTPTHARVAPGAPLELQVHIHPSLADTNVALDVQVRALTKNGAVGAWHTTRVFEGAGKDFASAVNVATPSQKGVYLVRTRLSWDATTVAVHDRAPAERATLLAAEDPQDVLKLGTALSKATTFENTLGCISTPEDEQIIELFNMEEFQDIFEIVLQDNNPTTAISLQCGDSPYVPNDFELRLWTGDWLSSTECRTPGEPITIDTAQLTTSPPPYCDGTRCTFMMMLTNRMTNEVYSETELQLSLDGVSPIIPQLEPATSPCVNSLPIGPNAASS